MPSAASVPARLRWWGSDRSSCTAAGVQGTCHTRQRTAARASDRSSPLGAAGGRRTGSSPTAAAGGPEKSRREDTAKERWRRERTLFGTCKGIGKGFDRQRHWRKAFEDLPIITNKTKQYKAMTFTQKVFIVQNVAIVGEMGAVVAPSAAETLHQGILQVIESLAQEALVRGANIRLCRQQVGLPTAARFFLMEKPSTAGVGTFHQVAV